MNFKEIKESKINKLNVSNSKFISISFKIHSAQDIDEILNDLKNKYNDATHICYAYKFLLNNQIKEGYFESKEPKNSSGKQLFNLINNKNIINILLVVIRYYGGTKLGVGLLTRSYLNSAKLVVDDNNLIDFINTQLISIKIEIKNLDNLLNLINRYKIEIKEKFINDLNATIKILVDDKQKELDFLKKYIN